MTDPDPTISHATARPADKAADPVDPADMPADPAARPADPADPAADPAIAATLKSSLRLAAMARRDALPAADHVAAAQAVAAAGLPVAVGPGMVVSGYSPLKSEISPLPLLRRCADAGARLALPVVTGRGHPLIMRAWSFGAPLRPGVWGIREPPAEAEEVFPDIVIVPLLAFDRTGQRIGYGAGYYDMTLARLRAVKHVTAIGIAFAAQEIAAVPATPRDAGLDLVLTERGAIDFRTP
jgi:5-formyltetrahydrofolate cyclo-ligase